MQFTVVFFAALWICGVFRLFAVAIAAVSDILFFLV